MHLLITITSFLLVPSKTLSSFVPLGPFFPLSLSPSPSSFLLRSFAIIRSYSSFSLPVFHLLSVPRPPCIIPDTHSRTPVLSAIRWKRKGRTGQARDQRESSLRRRRRWRRRMGPPVGRATAGSAGCGRSPYKMKQRAGK